MIKYCLCFIFLSTSLFAIEGEELAKRQCRSVHLAYSKQVDDPAFARASITAIESAPGTYFCALGFHMGYLGMQELANGKKCIIFSVWEPNHGQDPKTVPENQRTKLVRKGEGVRTGRFGNEGTGGQSFFDYDWKINETVRFAVRAKQISPTLTSYAGYFYDNKHQRWQLMTEFQTLAKGKKLGNRIYSFVEDFRRNYQSAKHVRKAHFTQIATSADSTKWLPMNKAKFTADPTPSLNINAGPIKNGYFLQTGGNTKPQTTKLWSMMDTNISLDAPQKIAAP